MDKSDMLLAALACGTAETYTPEDVQSLLFLISRQIPETIAPPPFKFTMSERGPFDPCVYGLLEELVQDSFLSILTQGKRRDVTLTPTGETRAAEMLEQLPAPEVEYMQRAARFVVAKSTRILRHIAGKADTGSSTSSRLRLRKKEPD